MIDTLDMIETNAAAGYAWLAKALPLLQAEYWFIGTILLAGSVWAVVRELPDAAEGRGDPIWGLVKYWLCALLGVTFLYVTVAGPLTDFAPRLDPAAAAKLGGNGRLTLPSYATEMLARDAVTVALSMSNPTKQQLVQVPAAQIAASKVVDSSLASSDPQLAANLRVWREVVAPAYLESATPVLRDALVQAGLMDAFLNPLSDRHADSPSTQRALQVRTLIDAANPMPLGEMLPALQPLINERLGGAGSWTAQGNNVAVAMVSAATKAAVAAPPAVPTEISTRPEAMDAYTLGRNALTAVYADPNRQPPAAFASLGELYAALGRANDVVAAANVLRDPMATMWFGATCQRDGKLCVRSLVDAQARQAAEASQGDSNTLGRYASNFVGFVATLAGRLIATVMEAIISSIMPASIGYAKAIVVLLSPVALLLMLWPGRFMLAIYLTVGAHAFIGLWTMFYVIWDRFTGAQLNAVAGFQAVGLTVETSRLLASNIAQLLIVAGYFGLTTIAFAIAMGATTAFGNAAMRTAGAGMGRMSASGDGAASVANKWGAGRLKAGGGKALGAAVTAAKARGATSTSLASLGAGGHAVAAPAGGTGGARSASAAAPPPAAVAPRQVKISATGNTTPTARVKA